MKRLQLLQAVRLLAILLALGAAGCSQEDAGGIADEPLIAEAPQNDLSLPPIDHEAALAAAAGETLPPLGKHEKTATAGTREPAPPRQANISPRFVRGETFPAVRTVTQNLVQTSPDGTTTGTSRLEANVILAVDETRDDGRSRLGVQFERIRYARELAGDRFEFDSQNPVANLPSDAMPYHGLAGNRFALWVGHDNQILELVGFPNFLERSLRGLPPEGKSAVADRFENLPPAELVSEFLDESVGLLRDDSATRGASASIVKLGASWTRTRTVPLPVPHHVQSRYTIVACNDPMAEIEILGTITAANEAVTTPAVVIQRGHLFGRSRIDRRTGLPIDSQIEQQLEMYLPTAEGKRIEQQKRVVSTFRVALPAGGTAPLGANAN